MGACFCAAAPLDRPLNIFQCSALHGADAVLPNSNSSPTPATWDPLAHLFLNARMPSLTRFMALAGPFAPNIRYFSPLNS